MRTIFETTQETEELLKHHKMKTGMSYRDIINKSVIAYFDSENEQNNMRQKLNKIQEIVNN